MKYYLIYLLEGKTRGVLVRGGEKKDLRITISLYSLIDLRHEFRFFQIRQFLCCLF